MYERISNMGVTGITGEWNVLPLTSYTSYLL